MRHILIILGICLAAIAIGAGLYFFGPKEFQQVPAIGNVGASAVGADVAEDISFRVLAEGQNAAIPERKNYAVYTEEDFAALWTRAYGEEAPALPAVNFADSYVIGVFAGEQATGGHAIAVSRITDENAARTVAITLTRPGAGCMVSQALTSPFQFVLVPFSDRALARVDEVLEAPCP
ncbi:MAG TPA: protease complex subunit PrcB family protein [Candidatus Paceibacterota bacterium]